MITIIDYHMGNLQSVLNGCEAVGYEAEITDDPEKISQATTIILPGVGAFGEGMDNLRNLGFIDILDEKVCQQHVPFLGICIGLQFIAQRSFEHGEHEGLGWIDADIVLIEPDNEDCKVPHMGWNNVDIVKPSILFQGLKDDPVFYFVHSYHMHVREPDVCIATCDHGQKITAAVEKENIFATQFHPEKSQSAGLVVLKNFLDHACSKNV